MDALPLWVLTHAEKLKDLRSTRIDLRRSLQMHRRLALGIAFAGVVLAAIYLYMFWLNGAAHGGRHSAALLNAAVQMLVSLGLGAGAAVIAHNLDSAVYIGSDIEQLLGVAPMAQLPDFAESPSGLIEDSLGALVNGIVHACPVGRLSRCVITGTGPGAGVTTIALRAKEKLAGMGRSVTLVSAEGAPHGESTVQEAADEFGSRGDSLILTDTAPLATSADSEYLARFADCVVVIVESGVTTRAQLRSAASCLQNLNLAAVGFVLNRVKLANANPEFRRSVEVARLAVGGEGSGQGRQFAEAVNRALADPPKRTPVAPAPQPQPAALLAKAKVEAKPTTALTLTRNAPESSPWDAPGIPSWLAEALAQIESEQTQRLEAQSAGIQAGTNRQPALFGTEIYEASATETEQVTAEEHASGNASQTSGSGDMLFEMESKDTHESRDSAAQSKAGSPAAAKPSRLSGLRELVSAEDLMALSQARGAEYESAEPGSSTLPPTLVQALHEAPTRLSGLRGLVNPTDLKDLNKDLSQTGKPLTIGGEGSAPANGQEPPVREAMTRVEPTPQTEKPAEAQTYIPFPETEQAPGPLDLSGESAGQIKPKPEGIPAKPPAPAQRTVGTNFDEVQILPSKRGQYRRKKS